MEHVVYWRKSDALITSIAFYAGFLTKLIPAAIWISACVWVGLTFHQFTNIHQVIREKIRLLRLIEDFLSRSLGGDFEIFDFFNLKKE